MTGIAVAAAAFAITLTVVVAIAVALGTPASTAQPSAGGGGATPSGQQASDGSPAATAAPTAVPTVAPPIVDCRREPSTPPPALAGDPCPSAITAVELAVATVRLPIDRLVIEPGPLFCNVVWEGVDSPPACYGPIVIPGQYMHAYVSFHGTDKVAVVMLGVDLPNDLEAPAATRPPWNTSVLAVAVPPDGWVMP